MIRYVLKQAIGEAIENLQIKLPNDNINVNLEHPADFTHGDYSSNVAMVVAKQVGMSPNELAEAIKTELNRNLPQEVEKVEVAGPGFINFYLSKKFFIDSLKEILTKREKYGENNLGEGKKVIVEYSSPNIAKPFSIGHLRSTIIGDAVANLLAMSGYKVIRDNHLGDWGTQFGKLIVAIKKWGDFEAIKKSDNPIKDLVALYVRFHDEVENDERLEIEGRDAFAKLENGDREAREIWQTCIDLSLREFSSIYKRLGVKFDTEYGESFFVDKIKPVYDELIKHNLLVESEGAKVVMFGEETKLPPLIVEKSDGSTIYAMRDLAADLWRKNEYEPDLIINEVGAEQSLYFQQLFKVEELLGWYKNGERVHVSHGMYRFKDGKMSTRKGNVIWLEDVLSEAVRRASEFNSSVAEEVGIGAIKYNDLKRESKIDIVFDWEEVLNLKGNSGPYLQYTYARTCSILEKAGGMKEAKVADDPGIIEKMLHRFPGVVERATIEYAPHHICTYLYGLASAFNSYYASNQIVSDEPTSHYRVALTAAVGQVLKNGLTLLGIKSPEKM
jgi:arginyl-tRNA synthetase